MADWGKLALIHCLVGYELDALGFVRYGFGGSPTQALLIIAFLLYTACAIIMALVKLEVIQLEMPITIATVVMLIIAGINKINYYFELLYIYINLYSPLRVANN